MQNTKIHVIDNDSSYLMEWCEFLCCGVVLFEYVLEAKNLDI